METSFYDLSLLTAPGRVFTPRPATERLVDAVLERIDGQPLRVADAGGTVLIQFHQEPLAADCWELEGLRAELETRA